MARTEADIQAEIDAVSSAISALVADPDSKLLDYSHGGRRFDKVSRLRELRLLKKNLGDELANLPCCEETVLDHPDV